MTITDLFATRFFPYYPVQNGIIKSPYRFLVKYQRKVDSTNTRLMEAARNGEKRNLIWIADRQTDGKGRKGRRFYSPAGTGLYMSILLQNAASAQTVVPTPAQLTTAAAVAVVKAIETVTGKQTGIKWVNDVWLAGKKVCGILAEGGYATGGSAPGCQYAVLGIGVNLGTPKGGFPPELQNVVTSLGLQGGKRLRNKLAVEITNELIAFLTSPGGNSHLDAYRKASCLLGKQITVYRGNDAPWEATAEEITDDFRLKVRSEAGEEVLLDSGEVSVRPTVSVD